MFDARKLLDAVVGASAQKGTGASAGGVADLVGQLFGQATQGLQEGAQRLDQATGGAGARINQAATQVTGVQGTGDLVAKAKSFIDQNPGMAQAALAGLAGLLLTSRKARGVAVNAASLGGLALIGGLAYKAFQNYQAGKPLIGAGSSGALPAPAAFDPAAANDDDALLYLRAMVAAASADGHIDQNERARIVAGMQQAGLDPEATRWLDRELAAPATVDELSANVATPEKAAQVYTAARIAIDPDTLQEREFLRQLAGSLDLEAELVDHIDAAAASIESEA